MLAIARVDRRAASRSAARPWLAMLLGIFQFVLNYNLVYAAELYITSGLAAVVFALLVVPNAALAWLFFGAEGERALHARLGGGDGRRRPAVPPGDAAAAPAPAARS